MRIHHARGAELRYVGNLDMQLVWERTLRRARLPVAFSQGFNPRPRFHMAAALPLGFTSRCEMLDLWLNEDLEPETLRQAVQAAAPPGLLVQLVERVELREPALQTLVCAAEYSALLRETPPGFDPGEAVQALLGETSLPREWRKKPYDLRPLIFALDTAAVQRRKARPPKRRIHGWRCAFRRAKGRRGGRRKCWRRWGSIQPRRGWNGPGYY